MVILTPATMAPTTVKIKDTLSLLSGYVELIIQFINTVVKSEHLLNVKNLKMEFYQKDNYSGMLTSLTE